MTETPPPVETPAKAAKRRRTRAQLLALIAGGLVGGLLALVVLLAVGGRMYLVTGPGRDLVTSFVAGQSLGRYGRINVEGLSGDLFDDFRLERVTVEDDEGVWLEARDVHVDWSYWPLITRRFHAEVIEAGVVRLIRQPNVEPSTEPGGPQPLSIDIDRFAADVELLEGFSQEYGRWRLAGAAELPRQGDRTVRLAADSLSREGDFLRLSGTFGEDPADLRLNLRAEEALGGPLAGALGYSPDQPFTARAIVTGRRVDALMRTGDFTPLTVQGDYGPDGSRISGYLDFSGSELLAPFVDRVGRTARFGFATVPVEGGELQGVGWRIQAENFESAAQGLIRTSDRSAPDGVRLVASTPSLSRLVGSPVAQATRYEGVFRGDAQAWTLEGAVDLTGLTAASYTARRVSGPLSFGSDDGAFEVETRLAAAGGASSGAIGGLLGPTPSVAIEATRDAEGAFLLRRIDAQGRAIRVTGQGGRNLMGGLRFDGRAEITNLAALRPGAGGAFGGAIRARTERADAPWIVGFEGQGRALRTSFAELDRLLGDTPRLDLGGRLNAGRISIDQLQLNGETLQAGARGLIEPDGRLRLALDWDAEGPFGVGPVAIDGAATGEGAVTGTLAQPRIDLTADFARVAAGPLTLTEADLVLSFRRGADASDGRITLTSGSNYGPASAGGAFRLAGDGVQLSDVDIDAGGITARGDIALTGTTPASADLVFTARPGAFLTSGQADGRIRLVEAAGPNSAILDVTGRDLRFRGSTYAVQSLSLQGRGSLERLPFALEAEVGGPTPVSFDGSGVYSRTDTAQSVTLSGDGSVRDIDFTTRSPVVAALSGDGRVVRVDLGVGGGVLIGELRSDSRAAVLQADLTSVELGSVVEDMRGRLTGRVSLRGAGEDLSGSANVTLEDVRSLDGPENVAIDGRIDAQLLDNRLRIQANVRDEGAVEATGDVTLPVLASAAPLRLAIARTEPMSGRIQANGQIQPIWDLFVGGGRTLAGQVDADAQIAGTLAAPRLNGRLNLERGLFRDGATGLVLNDMTLASRFDDEAAVIQTFRATDGAGGSVGGEGRLGLRQGSGSTFTLNLDGFTVIDNDLATVQASGPVTATRGADGDIRLAGRIDVDDAAIRPNLPGATGIVPMDVVEINRPGGDPVEEPEARARGPRIGLDVQIRAAGPSVHVTGRGLNVFLSLNARVTGAVEAPELRGTARVVRGDYEFAGKRFVFDQTGTVTLSTDPDDIRLNLAAVREDPALTATIRVTGTASRPEIALTSSPALPQDEILAQVLFGRSASQLSAFEAAQLASGVASLAGGGGFDIIGNLRELAGLDRLSFGGEASALTVAGGRYLSDDVYLEIVGGGEGGAGVNVEWQVRRNLAVTSGFDGQGDASLSIRWRRNSRQPGTGRRDIRPNAEE